MNLGLISLIGIEIIGILCFSTAAVFSRKNYKRTGHATLIWFLIMIAMILGTFYSFFSLLNFLNLSPSLTTGLKSLTLTGEVLVLTITSYVSVKHIIKPI